MPAQYFIRSVCCSLALPANMANEAMHSPFISSVILFVLPVLSSMIHLAHSTAESKGVLMWHIGREPTTDWLSSTRPFLPKACTDITSSDLHVALLLFYQMQAMHSLHTCTYYFCDLDRSASSHTVVHGRAIDQNAVFSRRHPRDRYDD